MATAVVTITIMPESPDTDLEHIKTETARIVREFAGERDTKVSEVPIAFGLKAVNFIFVMSEDLGSPDQVAEKVEKIKGVNSAEISDVRRAIG
jgi:elongation factor 1-beta